MHKVLKPAISKCEKIHLLNKLNSRGRRINSLVSLLPNMRIKGMSKNQTGTD